VGRRARGPALTDLATLLAGQAPDVAPGLLGCLLTAHGVTVRIVEVEAYTGTGEDPASHSHRGPTPRNAPMFGPPGTLYVYFTYGMHWCANVACSPAGEASAVLFRAGEVVGGVELARARRGRASVRDLARGPARLAQALGLDGAATGTSLLDGTGPALLTPGAPVDPAMVRSGSRVGVSSAAELPWRYWIDGDPAVSTYRPHVPKRRSGG
jgi:DNA-3-methyladenine glycosylase